MTTDPTPDLTPTATPQGAAPQPAPQSAPQPAAPGERDRLIDAALAHVPFDGMGWAAILAGARDIGMAPAVARALMPRGGADLAAAWHRRCDAMLADRLARLAPQGPMRERIAEAVMLRLELADRDLVRAGASVMALPQNAALGARLLWETADTIWRALGEQSDDLGWYSRRASLAAIHGATVLYWLGDDSPGAEATRAFLRRRIDEVMRLEKVKAALGSLPGARRLGRLATGWVRAPARRPGPGFVRGDAGRAAGTAAPDQLRAGADA